MKEEIELLRELEDIVRKRRRDGRLLHCHFSDVLNELDELRNPPTEDAAPESKESLVEEQFGPKRLWCRCGHHRDDHRRYDIHRLRDGSCLEDDCACEEFKSQTALSSRMLCEERVG
jgi:hypothetical protein